MTATLDEAVGVTVTTFGGFCWPGVLEFVCDVMVSGNRDLAGQIGCPGTWFVCSVAFGSP